MTGSAAARTRRAQRTVSQRHDPAEVQVDRAADAVARGGSFKEGVRWWAVASGVVVGMNPENGILLGLVGFAPTTAENYGRLLRPVSEIPRPLTTRKTR